MSTTRFTLTPRILALVNRIQARPSRSVQRETYRRGRLEAAERAWKAIAPLAGPIMDATPQSPPEGNAESRGPR